MALLKELKMFNDDNVELLVDSKSVIDLAKNLMSHERSKHIVTKYHFFQDQVSKGSIKLKHCRIELQLADVMTQALKTRGSMR